MSRARRAAALALIALTITAAGCSRKSDASAPSSSEASARIVATAGFGGTSLLDAPVSVGIPVIDGLRLVTAVETAYGGGFVASMLGRGTETSPPADWFFYVNGIESPVGAAQVTLGDGDVAWWDHHGWSGAMSIRGVVGSWPEPFVHLAPRVSADPPLAGALRAAGATVVTGASVFRVRVGTDASLAARDVTWRDIAGDPAGHHLAGGIAGGRGVRIPPGVPHGAINRGTAPAIVVNAVLRHRPGDQRDYQSRPVPAALAAAWAQLHGDLGELDWV